MQSAIQANVQTEELERRIIPGIAEWSGLKSLMIAVRISSVKTLVPLSDENRVANYNKMGRQIAEIDQRIAALRGRSRDEERRAVDEIARQWTEWKAASAAVRAQVQANRENAIVLYEEHLSPLGPKLEKTISAHVDALQARGQELSQNGASSIAASIRSSTTLCVLAALAALGVVMLLRHRVTGPLRRLAHAMREMAGGNLDRPVPCTELTDEVGAISHALLDIKDGVERRTREMADRDLAVQRQVVSELSIGLQRLAAQDLEYRIHTPFPDQYEELRSNYNQASTALAKAIGAARIGARRLLTTIREINAAADDLSQRNTRQAATVEETTAALRQVNGAIQGTATRAGIMRDCVTQTHDQATRGEMVVGNAVSAMEAIERSAQEINQIIGVIDGIAFQTNLLALNAGVEAARAGDAGKGFAVVATEVRALAQRSADAAKNIKELIATSTAHVGDGVDLVQQTGDVLGHILVQVAELTGMVDEIAAGTADQATAIGEVSNSVVEIDRVTQQNAAMVEQTSAATADLTAEAAALDSLVAQFRTRDPDRRPQVGGAHLRKASLAGAVAPLAAGSLVA
ncbi:MULTISPECIES: HAMP domain-containing methyl-accepting chemotaxis protein [unclassified Novosphingobium]|uniref:methyl-accepting chemotaxis protein n=1 Tax=unclassified Novosphingobium TaxID=2644732 RepID=UPI0017B99E1E|nr:MULTISPECIES: HAMP domain-containing methyl-accepting chemotaxis protein [unclassified Novosphingobium]NMN89186.1 methyl-accepting chemotaxis protein [Novosphingobium sp. SG916]